MARPRDVTIRAYADANVLVALLVGTRHRFHAAAARLFWRADRGEIRLIIAPIVLAETIWSARSALGQTQSQIASILLDVLSADGLEVVELPVMRRALELQVEHPRLDFADAYLAARGMVVGPPVVASFDRDLDRITGIERMGA